MSLRIPQTQSRSLSEVRSEIDELIQKLRREGDLCLNLGCGDHPIPGVVNCDLHNPAADVKVDITALPQYETGSVSMIETHHAIEHFSMQEVRPAIAEWARVLRPGGHLIVTCPDLEKVLELWSQSNRSLDSYEMKMLYGSQEHPGMFHKCGFCAASLSELLNQSGFNTLFTYSPYPDRQTPSLLAIAERVSS